jgi:YVTN family beta-propeller protein
MSKVKKAFYYFPIIISLFFITIQNYPTETTLDFSSWELGFKVENMPNAYGQENSILNFTYNNEKFNRNCELAIDEKNNMIYVSNAGKNSLIVINGSSYQQVSKIPVGISPCDVELDPARDVLYVLNELDSSISIIDTNEIKLLKTFHIPFIPYEMVVSNKTGNLYIVSDRNYALFMVNPKTEEVEEISSIEHPCGIGMNQLTNTIYASSEETDMVYVIDGENNNLVTKIKVGSAPRGITIDEKDNLIYVANSKSNSISVISGLTNSVEKVIKTDENPRRLIHDSRNNFIYSISLNPGLINIIDPEKYTTKSFNLETPNDLGLNSETDRLYLTNRHENIFYIENISILGNKISETEEKFCKEGYRLVFKATNGSPACVFPDSVEKLIERGWASNNERLIN